MERFAIFALPLLYILSQSVSGQVDSTSTLVFSGKIVDDSLDFTLPFVHLWNQSTRMGSISDDSGKFSINAKIQDTLVFSSIGYFSQEVVVSLLNQSLLVRLKSQKYELDEVIVKRFKSYESFKYQVVHLDLPESRTTELRKYIKATSTVAALEADMERANKLRTERFGYITPLGGRIDPAKAFKEKILNQKKREEVINAKFTRALVGDLTHLDGDELTEFIAMCNYSEEYLFETDFLSIIDDLYAKFDNYQNRIDTIPSFNEY